MNTDHILTVEDIAHDRLIRLTEQDITLLRGLIAGYQHAMLIDLRKGALTETGIRDYRRSLAEAGEVAAKLNDGSLDDAVRLALLAPCVGPPEKIGYGDVTGPAFDAGWNAAMERVWSATQIARDLLTASPVEAGEVMCKLGGGA